MDWEDVESHIRSMIENGTYRVPAAFLVDTQERNRVTIRSISSARWNG